MARLHVFNDNYGRWRWSIIGRADQPPVSAVEGFALREDAIEDGKAIAAQLGEPVQVVVDGDTRRPGDYPAVPLPHIDRAHEAELAGLTTGDGSSV